MGVGAAAVKKLMMGMLARVSEATARTKRATRVLVDRGVGMAAAVGGACASVPGCGVAVGLLGRGRVVWARERAGAGSEVGVGGKVGVGGVVGREAVAGAGVVAMGAAALVQWFKGLMPTSLLS